MLEKNSELRERYLKFSQEEKIHLFDEIQKNYFEKNFGTMSKSDLEVLLFSEFIEHCLNNEIPFDDFSLSKQLGITQTRIRSLKERKELKYPHQGFNWQNSFMKSLETAKYNEKNHYIKVMIQDVNVMNELKNYIEGKGWYYECTLTKKLINIPLEFVVDIGFDQFKEDFGDTFSDEAKKKIKELNKDNSSNTLSEFIKEFSKDGLKTLLMSGSKEIILSVLGLLPFGGPGKIIFDALEKVIKES